MKAYLLLVSLPLVGFVGCGKPGETMVPVSGRIKYEGKAMTKGTVVLHPDASKGNNSKHEPRGTVEADGTYKVTHPKEGAPVGAYKVTVILHEAVDPVKMYAVPKSLIPEKFGKPDESKLTLDVRKDAPPGAYDLDLK